MINKKIVTAMFLSCMLAASAYATTAINSTLVNMAGKWSGTCHYSGFHDEQDYNNTLNVDLRHVGSEVTIGLNSRHGDYDSHRYVVGGIERSTKTFPASTAYGTSMPAHERSDVIYTFFSKDGQKLEIQDKSQSYELSEMGKQPESNYLDETSLEIVNSKLVYKTTNWNNESKTSYDSTVTCELSKD